MRGDTRAVEGLPLRLMLVAVLISLTLPTVLSIMGRASSEISSMEMEEIADDIVLTIEEISSAGPGNVRILEMPTMPMGATIRLGGAEGSIESMRVSWSLNGKDLGTRYLNGVTVVCETGNVILCSGDSLSLSFLSEGCVRATTL